MTEATLLGLSVTFPDPAGALQSEGSTAALVAELGDNYATYHEFLASKLAVIGTAPSPADYPGDRARYMRLWATILCVLSAESVLRSCRAYRIEGRALDAGPDLRVPLLDEHRRLLSVETGQPSASQPPDRATFNVEPTLMPNWTAVGAPALP